MDDFDLDTLDLDDILADVEAEIAALDAEDPYDRHDRLRLAHDEAHEVFVAAENALSEYVYSLAETVTGYRFNGWRGFITSWPEDIPGRDYDMDGVRKVRTSGRDCRTVLPLVESVADRAETLWSLVDNYFRTSEAVTEAARVYREAKTSVPPKEGCYVSFRTKQGNNSVSGYGTVKSFAATSMIVEIDHAASYGLGDRATARISLHNMEKGVWSGGREVRVEWGPKGNAERAERARLAMEERNRQWSIRNAAQQRMHEAVRAYEAAKQADDNRAAKVANIPSLSRAEAERLVLMKYAAEVAVMEQVEADKRYAALGDYERPAVLDNPPSRVWQDYVEEEQ